jgi:hypothetical protein
VVFVVDKVTLRQVFSEYFGSPCQSSFHQFLQNHHHLSCGAGSGRSTRSPTAQIKKKKGVDKSLAFPISPKRGLQNNQKNYSWMS